MAHKLARLLDTSPEMWMNLQQAYDLAIVAHEKRSELDRKSSDTIPVSRAASSPATPSPLRRQGPR